MLQLAINTLFTSYFMQCMQKWSVRSGKMAAILCLTTVSFILVANGQTAQKNINFQPATFHLLGAGRDADTGKYRVVAEIILAPGYKTYWRDPGDSGVPTEFSWEKSEHVADVQIRYPTPTRFFDGVGQAIGYLQTVRFPIEVLPSSNGQNPVLRLSVSFGVCRELCIPEQAEAEIVLSDIEAVAGLWDEAIAALPSKTGPDERMEGLELKQARLTTSELSLTIAGDVGKQSDVFVEAPEGWQFGQPQRFSRDEGEYFVFPVIAGTSSLETVSLILTVKGEKSAIEVPLSLLVERP